MEDVGAVRSYDLHCTDDAGRTLWVEVKGTTGPLGSIVLTANEVEVARRQHPRTALFVIHNITLADDQAPEGDRGRDRRDPALAPGS